MHINVYRREINFKVVYYGPPLSGKTTNLERLHQVTHPDRRSELTSLKNEEDRTLFFDFLQLEMGLIGGFTPRINLYTVPGQVIYEATRQIVLRDADAIVFVADSAPDQLPNNILSWNQLHATLQAETQPQTELPIIVQLNKRDLEDAIPAALLYQRLQLNGEPFVEAQALHDVGIRETMKAAVRSILQQTEVKIP